MDCYGNFVRGHAVARNAASQRVIELFQIDPLFPAGKARKMVIIRKYSIKHL